MSSTEQMVFVVDDDSSVRKALKMLVRSIGLEAETYGSAKDFLEGFDPRRPGCLVLDVRMPGMSGLELQERLEAMHAAVPIIFITAHGDVPMAVEAMKAGAVDFLQKPFRDQDLIDRIQRALEHDRMSRQVTVEREEIEKRLASLTPREHEVMEKVVAGSPNKAIASDLDLSERTVEIHRARVMTKMEADSLPHLVQLVMRARSAE
jgi:FixJ family two-component response regulator